MKKLSLYLATLLLYSCNSTIQSNDFTISTTHVDSFVVTYYEHNYGKAPANITFLFKGDFINHTSNIYQKAVLNMRIVFTLQNGNTLDAAEMDRNPYGDIKALTIGYNWKPNQDISFETLISPNIPTTYVDYPISKVTLQLSLKNTNQINSTVSDSQIEIDITPQWNKAISKVQSGFVDMSDYELNNRT